MIFLEKKMVLTYNYNTERPGKGKIKLLQCTANPLVMRPVTISEVVLEGSCQNRT